jgi:hypothetical protein
MLQRLRIPFLCVATIAGIGLTVVDARAQGAAAALSGTVSDETGAVLPGVTVVIRNTDTSLTREVITDADGRFSAPNLPVGPYELTATLPGFATLVRSGITLTVGRESVVNMSMKVSQIEDRIEVVGEAPTVDTTSGSTGTLISEEQITNLPLNGRSYVELATLTPGVQLTQTGGQGTSTGYGAKLSVNGARYTANLFTLDGTSLNDQFSQAGSASGNVLGVEAVREFRVLTNSFSAEYGKHTGAVINAATKSGTNNFHGSVFEFHRNDALDARNFFDDPDNLPNFTRNQFGFSIGGPIQRDKLFFFATYEGLQEELGQTRTAVVPSEAARTGAADPAIRPFLLSYPVPNGRALDALRGEYLRVGVRDTNEHYAMVRVDRQFGPGSQVFARYTYNKGTVNDEGIPDRLNTAESSNTWLQYFTAEHTWIRGASFVNRAQFGLTSSRLDGFDYLLDGVDLPRLSFTDFTGGIATIEVTGLLTNWGGSTTNPKYHRFRNYAFSDTATWLRGRQTLKFGASIDFVQYDLRSDFTSFGQYTFNTMADFLNNRPNTFQAVMPGSDTSRNLRQQVFGFFVQDDIRVSDRLTLNIGVRYEPSTGITETEGRLAQLIDFASPTATLNDTTVLEELFQNPSKKTIAPRVGFAWDPRGNGKSALRGGAGVFYDLITAGTPFVQNTAVRVPPFINRGGLVGSPTFGINFPDAYTVQRERLAGQAALEGIQYDIDQPVMYKWNLNVQHEFPARIAVEVGYSGSRGVNLVRQIFTNGRLAVPDANGRLFVPGGAAAPLTQPNFQRMRWRVSDATSDYHGMTLSVSRRTAGLQFQGSYTWSKSIDEGASALGGNDFSQEGGGSRYLFLKDRGLSPFDTRHTFTGNVYYDLPFGRDGTSLGAVLARDWQVGTLVRLRSGYPFSVNAGIDRGRQQFAPRFPDLAPGADKNPVRPGNYEQYFDPTAFVLQPDGYIGNLGRNTLIGPGLATVDLQVSRDIRFGDSRAIQLRFEAFNLFNRVNLALPGTPALALFNANGTYRADAGRITATSTPARQMQLGIKYVF